MAWVRPRPLQLALAEQQQFDAFELAQDARRLKLWHQAELQACGHDNKDATRDPPFHCGQDFRCGEELYCTPDTNKKEQGLGHHDYPCDPPQFAYELTAAEREVSQFFGALKDAGVCFGRFNFCAVVYVGHREFLPVPTSVVLFEKDTDAGGPIVIDRALSGDIFCDV